MLGGNFREGQSSTDASGSTSNSVMHSTEEYDYLSDSDLDEEELSERDVNVEDDSSDHPTVQPVVCSAVK
ncbi:hypothetical protein K474DRAFT_1668921 [Panus rudis PR-1116 ss-1]|nr:hypothetical protein K474DRAFT_1668921 [Panus rudis PR-1116 ss-1]